MWNSMHSYFRYSSLQRSVHVSAINVLASCVNTETSLGSDMAATPVMLLWVCMLKGWVKIQRVLTSDQLRYCNLDLTNRPSPGKLVTPLFCFSLCLCLGSHVVLIWMWMRKHPFLGFSVCVSSVLPLIFGDCAAALKAANECEWKRLQEFVWFWVSVCPFN